MPVPVPVDVLHTASPRACTRAAKALPLALASWMLWLMSDGRNLMLWAWLGLLDEGGALLRATAPLRPLCRSMVGIHSRVAQVCRSHAVAVRWQLRSEEANANNQALIHGSQGCMHRGGTPSNFGPYVPQPSREDPPVVGSPWLYTRAPHFDGRTILAKACSSFIYERHTNSLLRKTLT